MLGWTLLTHACGERLTEYLWRTRPFTLWELRLLRALARVADALLTFV